VADVAPKRPAYRQDVKVRVTVSAGSVVPTGRVRVLYKGDRVGTAVLVGGKVVVTVKRNFAPGRHTLVVKYLGSDDVARSRDKVTIRVRRP
jgi:hypothetical protein